MHHAVIHYAPDGYTASDKKIMGRQAAGAGFLRAAAQSNAKRLICQTTEMNSAKYFSAQLNQYGFRGQTEWIPSYQPEKLAAAGCLYTPGPGLIDFAWQRSPISDSAYSLCGVTHTTASHGAMNSITQMLTAPVRSWDALICTSKVVQDTVHFLLERQAEFLREQLGATRFTLPQLPIIPLGAHCDDYIFSAEERKKTRESLGIAPDEIVVLFVGRLSFHAKANPLQMYTALEKSAQNHSVRLVQCGWFANEHLQAAFVDGAKALCPSIKMSYLDGNNADERRQAWACADIFISLSDNIQETFGLTPIEAMAAGLPVIVSDWNGYKDTVRDHIDGFRIPTLMPPAPLGKIFARYYDAGELSYDAYCGYTSQCVALDPVALESACTRLISDANLRCTMGMAGQQRARSEFDWSVIYRRYQTLWGELAERRRTAVVSSENHFQRPDRLDPFAVFASYPTTQLSEDHQVYLLPELTPPLNTRRQLAMNNFAHRMHPNEQDCDRIIQALSTNSCKVRDILALFPAEHRANIMRGLIWLTKMDAIRIVSPSTQ